MARLIKVKLFMQETTELGQKREDGAVLRILKIEELKPYFQNPVKWCDPEKLKNYMSLWKSGIKFPPVEVVEELPEHLKNFDYNRAVEVLGETMAKRLNAERELIIMDGHHRWFSAYLVGEKTITAWVTTE
jgi:hypothetical protein